MEIIIGIVVVFGLWMFFSAGNSKKKALEYLFEAERDLKAGGYDEMLLKIIREKGEDQEVIKAVFQHYLKKAIRSKVDAMPLTIFDKPEYRRVIELIEEAIDTRLEALN